MGGGGGFSKLVAAFNHVGKSLNLFMATTGGVWIILSFGIWGYVLYVEQISCVITNCDQHQWAIPSLFSIALEALREENIIRKLLSLSWDLFFKILLFQVTFLIFFSIAIFSPYIFRLVCYCSMQLCCSQGTTEIFRIIVNWCRVAVSDDKSTLWLPSFFVFIFFLIYFFLKLIVACVLCVIYVREDNDSNV